MSGPGANSLFAPVTALTGQHEVPNPVDGPRDALALQGVRKSGPRPLTFCYHSNRNGIKTIKHRL